jgi:hypothetical protein
LSTSVIHLRGLSFATQRNWIRRKKKNLVEPTMFRASLDEGLQLFERFRSLYRSLPVFLGYSTTGRSLHETSQEGNDCVAENAICAVIVNSDEQKPMPLIDRHPRGHGVMDGNGR